MCTRARVCVWVLSGVGDGSGMAQKSKWDDGKKIPAQISSAFETDTRWRTSVRPFTRKGLWSFRPLPAYTA